MTLLKLFGLGFGVQGLSVLLRRKSLLTCRKHRPEPPIQLLTLLTVSPGPPRLKP